ncbi:hypothetical protein MMA231_02758 [Asticcacaulis sp. MM231]
MGFQIQLSKKLDTLPITRDYMMSKPCASLPHADTPAQVSASSFARGALEPSATTAIRAGTKAVS